MSKILAVLGATGQQGSAVVDYVSSQADLSAKFNIRAITRNLDSDKARQLTKQKVEVVHGDVRDRASLEKALTGAHTLFAMTIPAYGDNALEDEFNAIKTIADVAVEKGVQHIIFSTLPSVVAISGGKFKNVTPFDAKAKGEAYIRSLPITSSFYCPGSFMENFSSQPFLAPRRDPDRTDTWVMTRNVPPQTQMPLINAVDDGGKFVGAILADPDKFAGKTICAATKLYSMDEMAAALSKSTGKTILYKQVSDEEFAASLPPPAAAIFVDYFAYIGEYGYFGPGTEEAVRSGAASARGRLATFEEFLEKNPYRFE